MPPTEPQVPNDIAYVALLFGLFVVPKWLQRYRVPGAISALLMGVAASFSGLFVGDPTVSILSTLGITALFLFAGLEIDGAELRRRASEVTQHAVVWLILFGATTFFIGRAFTVGTREGVLVALAIVTPSTGFILSSLPGFGLTAPERFSVKAKAIAAELVALTALFVALQSTSWQRLGIASAAMVALVLLIPLAFRLFARTVAPHAPRSEFAFLLMVAVVCAYATRRLGVYYLVGAFLVGVAAQRFRQQLPAMSSEKMIDALEAFGSVFIPFYFFNAGLHIQRGELSWWGLALGLAFVAAFVPLRIGLTVGQRRLLLGEPTASASRVAAALVPTLVFSLVLAGILRTEFQVPEYLVGALIIYTVVNTSIPAFVLRSAPPEFERVEAAASPEYPHPDDGAAIWPGAAPSSPDRPT